MNRNEQVNEIEIDESIDGHVHVCDECGEYIDDHAYGLCLRSYGICQ